MSENFTHEFTDFVIIYWNWISFLLVARRVSTNRFIHSKKSIIKPMENDDVRDCVILFVTKNSENLLFSTIINDFIAVIQLSLDRNSLGRSIFVIEWHHNSNSHWVSSREKFLTCTKSLVISKEKQENTFFPIFHQHEGKISSFKLFFSDDFYTSFSVIVIVNISYTIDSSIKMKFFLLSSPHSCSNQVIVIPLFFPTILLDFQFFIIKQMTTTSFSLSF